MGSSADRNQKNIETEGEGETGKGGQGRGDGGGGIWKERCIELPLHGISICVLVQHLLLEGSSRVDGSGGWHLVQRLAFRLRVFMIQWLGVEGVSVLWESFPQECGRSGKGARFLGVAWS